MRKLLKLGFFLMSSILFIGCAKQEVYEENIQVYSYEEDKDSHVLENEDIKFTLDPSTTYFQVLDKSNGSIWKSNPENAATDPLADPTSQRYLQSTVLLEYTNDRGANTIYNNYQYSIENGSYQITELDDGIQVDYLIGDVEKVFYIPNAISESRLQPYLDKMEGSGARQVRSYYRKIDIDNLRPTDNKSELLAKYPDLENEPVYELRESTQDYLKKTIEEIFAEAGYTIEDYYDDIEAYGGKEEDEKPMFNVSIIYRIEDGDLVIEVPFENMEWTESFRLNKLRVLPYLGAGSTDDEGFIMVPEGNGAIINFNNGRQNQNSYYTQVYGWDYGEERLRKTGENAAAFPVFGISKNGSSMLCMLEDYASVATIEADVSGRRHSYNYANISYTTLHYASLQVSDKTDKAVIVFENEKPTGSITHRYRFIDSDSYTGMAEAYRGYLMDKYPLMTKKEDSGVPVNITLIGAINKIKQRLGIPVSRPVSLTSYEEAYNIIKELNELGFGNMYVKYTGWTNGGLKQFDLNKIKPLKELGKKKDFNHLLEYAEEIDVPIYLDGIVQTVFNKGMFDGFRVNSHVAKYTSREIIKLYDFSPVHFGPDDERKDPYYFVKPEVTIGYMQTLSDYAKEKSTGVSFTDVGDMLGANYDPKNLITRDEVAKMHEEELARIASKGTGIMVNIGNNYALPYADFVTNMEIKGSKFQIIDYMVPFYSMVIHGLVDYSGVPINLSSDYEEQVLRSVESGAGLSFAFMAESTSVLVNSNYTHLYGTDYQLWKDKAIEIHERYEEELGHVFNQYITGHEYLTDGVFVTVYEDGTQVYVNYNYYDVIQDGIEIPARDYKVTWR